MKKRVGDTNTPLFIQSLTSYALWSHGNRAGHQFPAVIRGSGQILRQQLDG
jgi:hypothetical protein